MSLAETELVCRFGGAGSRRPTSCATAVRDAFGALSGCRGRGAVLLSPRRGLGRLAIAAVADHGDSAAVRAVLTARMHIGRDATDRLGRSLRVAVLAVGNLTDQLAYALPVGGARLLQPGRVHRTRALRRALAQLLLL